MVRAQMTASRWRRLGSASLVVVSLCLALANGNALSATTTVYKCFDRNLTVLYSDEPCSGERINVKTTDADPAALVELQHERDALARSTAQRIADGRRAALERASAPQFVYPAGEDLGTYGGGGAYYPAYAPYGYVDAPGSRPKRFNAAVRSVKQVAKPRGAPSPPYIIPRR